MGKDTVCRIEERKHPIGSSAIESINEIFNPYERFESNLVEIKKAIDEAIGTWLSRDNNHNRNALDYITKKEVT